MREQTDAERIECFFETMEIPDDDGRWPAMKTLLNTTLEELSKHQPAALVQHADAVVLKLEDSHASVRFTALGVLKSMGPEIVAQHADAVVLKLADSVGDVRWAALALLMELDPAAVAQHAGAIVVKLVDSNSVLRFMGELLLTKLLDPAAIAQYADALVLNLEAPHAIVRCQALQVLIELEPAVLAQHADAIVLKLEDPHPNVRCQALLALGKMGPAALVQHASAVLNSLYDTVTITVVCPPEKYEPIEMKGVDIASVGDTVHDVAMRTLHKLPGFVTHEVDFEAANLRSRILGRLGWYRYRLRQRCWMGLALYWYALPYRPSGPGHARDVEAWDRMIEE